MGSLDAKRRNMAEQSAYEIYYNNLITTKLLKMESNEEDLPLWRFNNMRGTFEIPFTTEKYQKWWAAGPTNAPTETDDKYFFDIDNLLDEYKPRIMLVEEMREFREAILKAEIRKQLLKRESKELGPPKWQFDFKRGLFDISFKTQAYVDWWNEEDSHSETETSSGNIEEIPEWFSPKDLVKYDYQYEKYLEVKYYLLERESKNLKPPELSNNGKRAKLEIPFETKQYQDWWADVVKSDDEAVAPDDSDGADWRGAHEFLSAFGQFHLLEKRITQEILTCESKNEEPPLLYDSERGSFPIPIQTSKYQDWWTNNGENIPRDELLPRINTAKCRKNEIEKGWKSEFLRNEFNHIKPSNKLVPDDRGIFKIPFKTEIYRNWWASKPKYNKLYEWAMYPPFFSVVKCFDPESFEDDSPFRNWLKEYLLKLEAKKKIPPKSTFFHERGYFEIQFETEEFQNWWNEKKLKDDAEEDDI